MKNKTKENKMNGTLYAAVDKVKVSVAPGVLLLSIPSKAELQKLYRLTAGEKFTQ